METRKYLFFAGILLMCTATSHIICSARSLVQGDDSYINLPSAAESVEDSMTEKEADENISLSLEQLSLKEKVAQMFFITPEALTGVDQATEAGEMTESCFSDFPVGGIIYFSQNIVSREQMVRMLGNMQQISESRLGIPIFLGVDEEGGSVLRVSGSGVDNIPYTPDMLSIGATGDADQAFQAGAQLGNYLSELGFNVDFAPVADIFSNCNNTVIGDRAFGYSAETVAPMVAAAVKGLASEGMMSSLKHFPGHGDTAEDSHVGYACSYKSMEELRNFELIPFAEGIAVGADFVMVGHISLPNVIGDYTPATLSYTMVTQVLKEEMQFEGVVITDALNMGAIANNYSSGEAAVRAVEAGIDMLLMPSDFQSAYYAVLDAVNSGRISEKRIDDSVRRILKVKGSI